MPELAQTATLYDAHGRCCVNANSDFQARFSEVLEKARGWRHARLHIALILLSSWPQQLVSSNMFSTSAFRSELVRQMSTSSTCDTLLNWHLMLQQWCPEKSANHNARPALAYLSSNGQCVLESPTFSASALPLFCTTLWWRIVYPDDQAVDNCTSRIWVGTS